MKYSVRGIKNLDEWAELSFYNKTIKKPFSMQKYNIKGIYGTNGAGKSGIIRSVEILKFLIIDPNYLINPFVQRQLGDLINKKTRTLEIQIEFLHQADQAILMYYYTVTIERNSIGVYGISSETLSFKNALSRNAVMKEVYRTESGSLFTSYEDEYNHQLTEITKNLLNHSTLPSIFISRKELVLDEKMNDDIWNGLASLSFFAANLFIYMDHGDDHLSYYMDDYFDTETVFDHKTMETVSYQTARLNGRSSSAFSAEKIYVKKDMYSAFERKVRQLSVFLCMFKDDLLDIKIDKREDTEDFVCSLIMDYGEYTINAEFESTGIKKLIRLFDYLDKMVQGGIVFIDEFDANLHDVYLCALLEYLMENAKGQLCFTTHNIGPMDVLKKNKKSIDFLSKDHKIYSWKTNGNYSPSSLYRGGMIEGSAFNIFPFDFIRSFQSEEDAQ